MKGQYQFQLPESKDKTIAHRDEGTGKGKSKRKKGEIKKEHIERPNMDNEVVMNIYIYDISKQKYIYMMTFRLNFWHRSFTFKF
jgi:hypothetical protein